MKTVQEWLKEVDEEKLVDTYFSMFPIDYEDIFIYEKEATQLPLKTIRERMDAALVGFIHRLKKLTPGVGRSEVFFATKVYQEGHSRIETMMCDVDELLTQKCPERYDWSLMDFEQVMGCRMADTELTQENIYDVLACILEELSFFGYTQKEHEEGWKRLNTILKDAEAERQAGEYYTQDEMRERFGWEPKKADPEAEEREQKIFAEEIKYGRFCFEREVAAVRELLRSM